MKRSVATHRYRKDLRKLDPESPEYWEEVLRREGLSMSAGLTTRVVYAGSSSELERLAVQPEPAE